MVVCHWLQQKKIKNIEIFIKKKNKALQQNHTFSFCDLGHLTLLVSHFLICFISGGLVCGYAIDISGNMIDGVVVEKNKARITVDTEKRKKKGASVVENIIGIILNVFF